jgi:cellulose biosynthesis protein BcsQ
MDFATNRITTAKKPYVLAVTSQKGGTARTTTSLALAWTWGRLGLDVTLVDADPVGATGLVASNCTGVKFVDGRSGDGLASATGDLVVIDAPALTAFEARGVLDKADGVLLTGSADPLSIRTIMVTNRRLAQARETNPWLKVVGLLITIYDESVPLQAEIFGHLGQSCPDLLINHPIPELQELREWPATLTEGLPDGPARLAYSIVADEILGVIQPDLRRNQPNPDVMSWGDHFGLSLA